MGFAIMMVDGLEGLSPQLCQVLVRVSLGL